MDPPFDLKVVALGVWRRRRMIAALTILLTGGFTLLALQLRASRYRASSRLLIDTEVRGISTGTHAPTLQYINVPTLAAMVKLDTSLAKVRRRLGLQMTVDQIARTIEVITPRKTKIIEIHVIHERPSMAARIANAVADVTVEEAIRQAKYQARETLKSVNQELIRISREIGTLERQLVKLAERDATINPKGETSALISTRRKIDADLSQARIEKAQAEARLRVLLDRMKHTPGRIVDGIRDTRILQRALVRRRMELSQLQGRYTERHPEVIAAQRRVAKTQRLIAAGHGNGTREIMSRANPVRTQIAIDYARQLTLAAASDSKVTSLERKLKDVTSRLLALPEITLRYQEQVRRLQALTDFQVTLLKRREEARLVRETSVRPVRKLSAATIPDPARPLSSKAKLVALAGAFLSALLSLGLAVLLSIRDRRLKGNSDALAVLKSRLVGRLPDIDEAGERYLADRIEPGPLGEVFRNLSVELPTSAAPLVLQVSGIQPGDGASLVTANLARALGRGGRKVAVVDLNLRATGEHPLSVSDIEDDGEDLTVCLREERTPERGSPAGAGVVLYSGSGGAPDSAELLGGPTLRQLVDRLRSDHEVVLLDGPPLTPYADGRVLAELTDQLLLVATPWRTAQGAATRAVELLHRNNRRVFGVFLNRTDPPPEWRLTETSQRSAWARSVGHLTRWFGITTVLVAAGLTPACRPNLPPAPVVPAHTPRPLKHLPSPQKFKVTAPSSPHLAALGPGDRVRISVFGEKKLSRNDVLIWPDGRISLPLAGRLLVAGKTPAQLEDRVTRRLRTFLRDPRVTVALMKVTSRRSSVLGQVTRQGSYPVRTGDTLLSLLATAGGLLVSRVGESPRSTADLRNAVVMRRGQLVLRDFRRLMLSPRPGDDLPLQGGEVIYIPGTLHRAAHVLGEVKKPARLLVSGQTTVTRLLALAGGATKDADLDDVRLVRGGLGSQKVLRVSVRNILAGKAQDVRVLAGDILYVPPTGMAIFNRKTSVLFRLIGAGLQAVSLGIAMGR
jgi:polysaccharide biosynthesis/export protein